MILYIIRNIIPVLIGWICCEIYHRWEDKDEQRRIYKKKCR